MWSATRSKRLPPARPLPTRPARADALALLKKYGLRGKIPASIPAILEQVPETPKPGDPIFAKVQNVIVGSGLVAAQAALAQARTEGFNPYLLRIDLQGEARQAAFELATFLRQAKQTGDPVPRPACIVAGGETTVTLRQVSPVPAVLAQAGRLCKDRAKAGAIPNWPWRP